MALIEEDVSRLRNYIDNVAKSGDLRLPSEPKLGEELGVSRGSGSRTRACFGVMLAKGPSSVLVN
jgi:hypothetical protein